MEGLFDFYVSLAGLGALLSLLLNLLKHTGLVKEGKSQVWATGLNLLFLTLVFVAQTFFPDVDLLAIDQHVLSISNIGELFLGLILQLSVSKGTHAVLSGIPIVGKTLT